MPFFLLIISSKAYAQPVPNFSADVTSGCAPLIVHFQDLSTGGPTSWKWDLGNSTTSFQQNPTATYFSPGSYTVKLIVENASGKDSIIKIAYIVVNDVPTVNFSASITTGCYPLTVKFTDLTVANSGINTEWTWDFGDGNVSSLQNPQHTYMVAGNFGVTLKVKNSTGCFKFLNKPSFIVIPGGAMSNFSVGTPSDCGVPSTVGFTNLSLGTGILNYQWSFGDGGTSVLQTPSHIYNAPGSYTVTLITSNNTGCTDTLIKTNAVTIGNGAKADFVVLGTKCPQSFLTYSNTSSSAPTSSVWYLANGDTSTQISPTEFFTVAGTYQVKLVATFGVCKDSITKQIIIADTPRAIFVQSGIGACLTPFTVNFTNNSIGAASSQWLFGDGGTSSQTSPTNSYTHNGSFDVTLMVTNAAGCADTVFVPGAVNIGTPVLYTPLNLPHKGCAPYVSDFKAVVASPDAIVSYEWDFGDGSPIQNGGVKPTHTYNNIGSYNVTVTVTTLQGCKDTLVIPDAVVLSAKPHADFSATPLSSCAIDPIHFTDASTGTIQTWFWTFGDGGANSLQNPIYNYSDTGKFTVTLVVSNNGCKDTLVKPKYIYIIPPIAKFAYKSNCDTPFLRRFDNQSLVDTTLPYTYLWDFKDGTFSSDTSPVHTFPAPGWYLVKLTVTNGACTHFLEQSIRIVNSANVADFVTTVTNECKNTNVLFEVTGIDTADMASYIWDYGDGFIDTTYIHTTSHNYTQTNANTVFLSAIDINGCIDSVYKPLPIIIYGPTVGFANPPGGTCIHGTLTFIDTSHTDGFHPIIQWIWNYGDGGTDTLTAPPFAHQYNVQGNFPVKLIVKDAFGCYDSLSKPAAVLITKPVANFNTADTIRCSNSNVTFNNLSQGINLTYQWGFGDADTSIVSNPQHPYADTGRYSIKLIIKDLFGCTDSIFKPLYVHVANPKADYVFLQGGLLGLCYPYVVEVASKASLHQSISWSFGDGGFSNLDTPLHIYNYVGGYPLTLRAYGYGGCVDSVTKQIEVRGPTGSFTYAPLKFCQPDSVTFIAQTLNNASFVWDFADGVILTTGSGTVGHNYKIGGLFRPKMILIDAAGCQVPILGKDTIVVADVETYIKVPQTQYCDSVHLDFKDSTIVKNDVVNSYLWDFGDATTSTQQHPQHFYPQPGNYTIKLKVTTSFGCTFTDTLNVPIHIVQTPIIKIGGDSTGCVNTALNFIGTVVQSDTSAITWNWNFSNGNNSALQNPLPQLYLAAGTFNVTAISSNASGCADTVHKNVIIHPLPTTNAGIDSVVCKGQSITLQPSGAATYTWVPNSTLSCSACTNPVATPDTLMFYKVTGYTSFGCSTSDSVLINVIGPFNLKVSLTDTLCFGESTQLLATGGTKYTWTPTAGLNDPSINNPIATPTATITYTVNVTDPKNCFSLHDTVRIKVYPIPQFNIIQSLIKANVGNTVPLLTTSSADITKWKWLPIQWLSCTNCATPIALIKENIKYVAEASNPGGCVTKDEVTIEALCNDMNIFIPNTFSPNGDNANDVFYPRGKGLFKIKSLRVFNRWGEVVFSRDNFTPNDPAQGWDGTYKGSKLSSDVYVFTMEILCDNSQVLPVKGNLTLLR